MALAVTLVASAVIAVASPATTSIVQKSQSMNTWRHITIKITNCSRNDTLANPRTYTYSGYCHNPPQPTIARRTKEACSFSKTAHTACGSCGVLTYQIRTDEEDHVGELAIMFSVPYDYNLYENMFAVGIFQPDIPCDEDLFNQMYYGSGPFTRGKGTGSSITYSDKDAVIKGTMSAAGRSVIHVEFYSQETNLPLLNQHC